MKKSILLPFLFALGCLSECAAQPLIEWQKSLGGTGADEAQSIKQTNDGGYIVAGDSRSDDIDVTGNHGNYDYWVVKLDDRGTIQWQKSLGGTGEDRVQSIEQTNDGGYIVGGYSISNDGDVSGNHGGYDYWVVKLTNSGNIIWQKSLGGTTGENARSIQQTNDGGYIVAGYSTSNDGDAAGSGNHGGMDFWIVKLDNTGNIEWQESLGGASNDNAFSILQTNDGGYIVTGSSSSTDGDVTGNHGSYDYWVVKLDNTGNITWQKSLGGTDNDDSRSIQQTSDGGYIVAGFSFSNNGDVTGNHGNNDYWIVKLDGAGNIIWQKALGGTSGEAAYSIQQTRDNGFVIAGFTTSNDGDVSGNNGNLDYWVVKLDNNGIILWKKSLGGIAADSPRSILQTKNGGYIVFGSSTSNDGDVSSNYGSSDYWIVKLVSDKINISGSFFYDTNSNCISENGEAFLPNHIAQVLPGPYYGYSVTAGNYSLWIDTGNYSVSLVPKSYWLQDCPLANGNYSVISGVDSIITGINFSSFISTFCADLRIGLGTIRQRRCFGNNRYLINVCNHGNITANDITVALHFPVQLIPLSSSIPWTIGTNGEYLFNIDTLLPEQCIQFIVTDSVSCAATLGQVVCVSAAVNTEPIEADCNLSDNTTRECTTIIASYDPNDKQVASQQFEQNAYVTEEEFMLGDTLHYLIRFQNTGNDTAFIVIVRDTLSSWLDPVTVVTDVASHAYEFRISGHGVLEWRFNNILLPDSTTNEEASHGFIKYHLLPRDTMPPGGIIYNEADIYFDYNNPITTNQTISTLAIVTSNANDPANVKSWFYPNPATSEISINGYNPAYLRLTNFIGQTILEASNTNKLWLGNLPQGFYLLQLFDAKGNLLKTEKVVKE
jgi:uncharacterized repeat protein (TIGR01451 family)